MEIFQIKLMEYLKVKNIGNPIETFKSLKKLISSKIFNMKANVKNKDSLNKC